MKKIQLTAEVIAAINEELAYQGTLTQQGRDDDIDHGVEGRLVTLQVYVNSALEAWVKNPGEDKALDQLRKCAAIARSALVNYGCPRRKT